MREGRKENLIDPKDRTSEELREMTRKGGIKSGEARRRKKTMREALEMLMFQTPLPEMHKKMLEADGVKDKGDLNHQMVITRSLIAKAESGDVQAYHAICAMIGEKPADKMELSGEVSGGCEIRLKYVGEEGEDDFPSSESEVKE